MFHIESEMSLKKSRKRRTKMAKRLIAFDLDGTLADSKSPLTDEMADLLGQLLERYKVCVISGGKYEQFEKQLISNLHVDARLLDNLHLMPTSGTKYITYNAASSRWDTVYSEDIPERDKARIVDALERAIDHFGYREEKVYGDTIEDRGSQITFSALGQEIVSELGPEGVKIKERWDPDGVKKRKIRDFTADIIEDYEVRTGGSTSIDITLPGVDKAYGINRLAEQLSISRNDMLFIGDALYEGGNDYPVKAIGVDTISVESWKQTALVVETLIKA